MSGMKVFITFFALLASLSSFGQMFNPVSWSFSAEEVSENVYDLKFNAKIESGWAIYSQFIGEDGPIPTSFEFEAGGHFTRDGEVKESDNAKKSHDPIFEMELIKFYKTATFTQRVEVSDKSKPIAGYLTFMTCNDERCLPPTDVDFTFALKDAGSSGGGADAQEEGASDGLYSPVKWSFVKEQTGDKEYLLKVTGTIDDGWYVYSQNIDDGGPIPTSFYFAEIDGVEYTGDVGEVSDYKVEGMDPIFQMDVIKYKKEITFVQKAIVDEGVGAITGEFEFMTCDDERCLAPTYVDMEFILDESSAAVASAITTVGGGNVIDQTISSIQNTYEDPVGTCFEGEAETKDKSLIWTFILGFAGGLLALLTPCVFPMIPLTVSFFSKDTKRKGWVNGAIYGASIIVIYVALGLIITATFGAEALNELSTNWIANTIFFLIFMAFAFSFFGYYEIQLPSSWANKSDRMADKGGLIGTFFMAFTLALVSFSCTGPIIGSALVQSASSSVGPFVVMLGFSSALALPFGLFAAFPTWLNSLPKSGGWMNSVKVILGFLELALAFKFLSVADMTSHWGVLRYELFLGIWVIVAVGMALYLFGVIRFPHDSKVRKVKPGRLTLAVGCSVLAVYLATGFLFNERTQTYNALPMLSGLAPPAHYNFFMPVPDGDADIKARYASFTKCANNLDCFKDYSEGVAYAKEVNKPVFLDFTGYGCVNCRKTEEHIWVKDQIWPKLKNDFVMISLYVDDREPLDSVLISKPRNETLRNIGNKWSDFQIVNFQQNSQPLYVIMSPDEKVLAKPRGYREGVDEYSDFLDCGLSTFAGYNGRSGELR